MSAAATLSILVCCYTERRWDDVLAAVDAVLPQLAVRDELLVVVDHAEGLQERLTQRYAGTRVRVLANVHSQGLSGARNSGVGAATGEALVFLDDDAVPPPDWLEVFRTWLADASVTGVAGAVQPAWEGGSAPSWFPEEFGWVVGCDYRGLPSNGNPVRNPIGASMALRRAPVQEAGGFSELVGRVGALPVGCEETELSIRLRAAEPRTLIVRASEAPVRHRVPVERQRWAYFLSRCYHEGRSKAVLSHLVGSGSALESERNYVSRTLPTGVVRHLRAALRGDLPGLARATAIGLGLLTTAAGYLSAQRNSRTR